MKVIIAEIVREEIEGFLRESQDAIKEMVATSLLPQLRTAVRSEIADVMAQLMERLPEIPQESPIPIREEPHAEPAPDKPHSESIPSPAPDNSASRKPQADSAKVANAATAESATGLYLYCIADGGEAIHLDVAGIEDHEIYTIPFKDLSAVVHNCPAEPYQSEDQEKVKGWVLTHQEVMDAIWEKFGTIIPMGFDTIIQGRADAAPEENMKTWLKDDYDNLKTKMAKIRDKAEYGVQIFWETRIMAHGISEESAELKALQKEIETKPKGVAYMYRQKLEELLKKEMENKADRCFQEFFEKIKRHADDLHVETTKKAEDENQQMLLNLSCLLPGEQSKNLGEELEKIDALEGFSVRFTGPWPPYSFV